MSILADPRRTERARERLGLGRGMPAGPGRRRRAGEVTIEVEEHRSRDVAGLEAPAPPRRCHPSGDQRTSATIDLVAMPREPAGVDEQRHRSVTITGAWSLGFPRRRSACARRGRPRPSQTRRHRLGARARDRSSAPTPYGTPRPGSPSTRTGLGTSPAAARPRSVRPHAIRLASRSRSGSLARFFPPTSRVPDVAVVGRDVEVAGNDQRSLAGSWVASATHGAPRARRAWSRTPDPDLLAVHDVDAHDVDPTGAGGDHAGLLGQRVALEPGPRVLSTRPGKGSRHRCRRAARGSRSRSRPLGTSIVGNAASSTLVSCRHTTSGSCRRSSARSAPAAARTEFTFQVTSFMRELPPGARARPRRADRRRPGRRSASACARRRDPAAAASALASMSRS